MIYALRALILPIFLRSFYELPVPALFTSSGSLATTDEAVAETATARSRLFETCLSLAALMLISLSFARISTCIAGQ